jgi:hypothetical protein
MKRILLVLTVAALMAVVMAMTAAPAMAAGHGRNPGPERPDKGCGSKHTTQRVPGATGKDPPPRRGCGGDEQVETGIDTEGVFVDPVHPGTDSTWEPIAFDLPEIVNFGEHKVIRFEGGMSYSQIGG